MMRRSTFVFSLFAVSLCLITQLQAQTRLSGEDKEAIKEIKETYRMAWLRDDSETILGLFADDATIYPNGLSPRVGKKAMTDFWFAPGDTKTTITDYKIELDRIDGEKHLAFATGSSEIKWTMTNRKNNESKSYASKGNFMTLFSRKGKRWIIARHIWNGKFEEIN
ncbi:MAG: nuclear transport factor 2 family protein [Acidobacteriota bacterium]|nr:nuclear transport factor 2 family protein [Acidobacteriota bacterium]MDH3530538.1 nuclear transport factor 2 family protein [Acidobacteriota bacterium]